MNPHSYKLVLQNLNEEICKLEQKHLNSIDYCKHALILHHLALEKIKSTVITEGFSSSQEEIYFFKKLKPQFVSNIIYYCQRIHIELGKPVSHSSQKSYFCEYSKVLNKFFKKHRIMVIYYRNDLTHSDELYFLRNKKILLDQPKIEIFYFDNDFSTLHDYTFSKIIAYENLIKWIDIEILQLESPVVMEKPDDYMTLDDFRWTGLKVYLIELAYSIYFARVINNGNIDIKTIINLFEKIFHINLDDYSRTFLDIKNRKTNRTKFLDKLKELLLKEMDNADE
jgi:hypothetical protein